MATASIGVSIVDNPPQITKLQDHIDLISQRKSAEPFIYIDLEGNNLSRSGTISILTILLNGSKSSNNTNSKQVYLIDVHKLGVQAFNTTASDGKNLRGILQDDNISKVFFDVRNDADALFAHYQVKLRGVEDIQLMESASRKTTHHRRLLNGLARCIEDIISGTEVRVWKQAKEAGKKVFAQATNECHNVFDTRPITNSVAAYCAGDVQYLPLLWRTHVSCASKNNVTVKLETKKRVEDSMKPGYQPHGAHKALAPWSVEQNKAMDNLHKPTSNMIVLDDLDDDEFDDVLHRALGYDDDELEEDFYGNAWHD
jgi:exonuclease 3'-5' domain-containing protein 1